MSRYDKKHERRLQEDARYRAREAVRKRHGLRTLDNLPSREVDKEYQAILFPTRGT